MADNARAGREEKCENLSSFKTNGFIPQTTNNQGKIDLTKGIRRRVEGEGKKCN